MLSGIGKVDQSNVKSQVQMMKWVEKPMARCSFQQTSLHASLTWKKPQTWLSGKQIRTLLQSLWATQPKALSPDCGILNISSQRGFLSDLKCETWTFLRLASWSKALGYVSFYALLTSRDMALGSGWVIPAVYWCFLYRMEWAACSKHLDVYLHPMNVTLTFQ